MIVGCRIPRIPLPAPGRSRVFSLTQRMAPYRHQSGKGTREIIIPFATTSNPVLDNEKGPSSPIQDLWKSRSLRSAQCNVVRSLGCSGAGACGAATADDAESEDRHPNCHQHARIGYSQPQQPLSCLYL